MWRPRIVSNQERSRGSSAPLPWPGGLSPHAGGHVAPGDHGSGAHNLRLLAPAALLCGHPASEPGYTKGTLTVCTPGLHHPEPQERGDPRGSTQSECLWCSCMDVAGEGACTIARWTESTLKVEPRLPWSQQCRPEPGTGPGVIAGAWDSCAVCMREGGREGGNEQGNDKRAEGKNHQRV